MTALQWLLLYLAVGAVMLAWAWHAGWGDVHRMMRERFDRYGLPRWMPYIGFGLAIVVALPAWPVIAGLALFTRR